MVAAEKERLKTLVGREKLVHHLTFLFFAVVFIAVPRARAAARASEGCCARS